MEQIIIKTQPYFTGSIKLLGYLLPLFAILVVVVNWVLPIVFIFLSVLILTTNYKLTINPGKNTIYDHIWVLGFKKGETYRYNELIKVFVNSSSYSQGMTMKSIGNTVRFELYQAYIMADDKKFFLGESKSKQPIEEKGKQFAKHFNIPFQDVSE